MKLSLQCPYCGSECEAKPKDVWCHNIYDDYGNLDRREYFIECRNCGKDVPILDDKLNGKIKLDAQIKERRRILGWPDPPERWSDSSE